MSTYSMAAFQIRAVTLGVHLVCRYTWGGWGVSMYAGVSTCLCVRVCVCVCVCLVAGVLASGGGGGGCWGGADVGLVSFGPELLLQLLDDPLQVLTGLALLQ